MALGTYLPGRAGNVSPERYPKRSPTRSPGGSVIIESFEDGDIAEYAGDTAIMAVNGTFSPHGDFGVELNTGIDGGSKLISSTSGLDRYPEQGEVVRWRIQHAGENSDAGPLLFTQSESNTPDGYQFTTSSRNDQIQVREWSGSSFSGIGAKSVPIDADGTYIGEARPDLDGTITMNVYDVNMSRLQTVETSSATYSSGGLGFHVGTGLASQVTAYIDQIEVV